jgi:NADH dehydrogenase/NADH:ubiquinone oxidoreductase subunit G
MKYSLAVLMTMTLISCSSNPQKSHKDVVVARIDDLSERPSWFSETLDTEESGDKVIFWGRSTLKKGERLELGYKIAELNAKSRIANFVSEKIRNISQAADEVNGSDESIFRGIITQRAKVQISQIMGGKRYWEKVETSTTEGERELEYRVFQSVSIKKGDLAQLVKLALQDGKDKLTPRFREKVENEFEEMAKEGQDEVH